VLAYTIHSSSLPVPCWALYQTKLWRLGPFPRNLPYVSVELENAELAPRKFMGDTHRIIVRNRIIAMQFPEPRNRLVEILFLDSVPEKLEVQFFSFQD